MYAVGEILQKTTKENKRNMKIVDYANKYLFEPLGIKKHINSSAETAEDMAKIGLVCLNKGNYNGKKIVSSKWINEMTKPRVVESKYFRGMEYVYLWWIIDNKKNIYSAI